MILTISTGALKNLGHKLSDDPCSASLSSILSDWQPIDFFQRDTKNCKKRIFLHYGKLLWYWYPHPGYHHVKAHVLRITKCGGFWVLDFSKGSYWLFFPVFHVFSTAELTSPCKKNNLAD